MKTVLLNEYGPINNLNIKDIDIPRIGKSDVLVKVHAAGINPLDWKIAEGEMKRYIPLSLPYVLGHDFAGIVHDTGENVKKFKKGDEVYGMLDSQKGGAFAEFVSINQDFLCKKPKNTSMSEAAAIPLTALAALEGLRTKGKLKKGDDVLINGASGGVGTMAIQIANALGANEVTAVCSARNADLVKKLGADHVIDYKKTDFTKQKEIYEIIFDTVGTASFFSTRSVLEPKGKYISTLVSPANMILGFLTTILSGRQCEYIIVRPSGSKLAEITQLVETHKLKPVIEKVYKLTEIHSALERSMSGRVTGKLVLTID